jgi:hypothetical protein
MEEPAENECFICTETTPAPRKSACLCTDRYVHDACFLKMLESQSRLAATKCYVCGADHGNLQVVARRVVRVWSLCGMVALVACCIVALATIFLSTWSTASRNGGATAFIVVSYVIMGMGMAASMAVIATLAVLHGPRALAETCVPEMVVTRVVSVPTVELPERGSEAAGNA